ncbi:MAG: ethanolamine ammonia-lyase reactivating factor EutA [Chloroflexi bacterium]|nr:ethanolamine ammonia-lyase reactivating factor EutA [Chloroflexota bacterium]
MNGFEVHGHYHDFEGHEDIANTPMDEQHQIWAGERIELKSVGIDIGSTTSHLIFSRIVLLRKGALLSSQFRVVGREITYRSKVLLTPFVGGVTIAVKPLSSFIFKTYKEAGFAPEDIDTGAVIITGDAARRENAEAITALFSREAGKFVCATAGPNLEARMAAYGSGAVAMSKGVDGKGVTVMNVDIGGGTTKIAIVQNGSVVETVSLNVGARLIAFDEARHIVRIEEAGRLILAAIGLNLEIGDYVKPEEEQKMAKILANCLFEVMERKDLSPLCYRLMITPPLAFTGRVEVVTFSGGISEYIYGHEDENYGDIGSVLALEIRQLASHPEFNIPLKEPVEGIRATVIGASQYTVQVSGSTIFISRDGVLPLRNLQVVTPRFQDTELTPESIKSAIELSFHRFDMDVGERSVALAMNWRFGPAYSALRMLAQGISSALKKAIEKKHPLVLVFDTDIAKLLGNMLVQEFSVECDVVSIDGIELQDFDYIDIGEVLTNVSVVPVAIKSLIFAAR